MYNQMKKRYLQASMLELQFLREVDARGNLYTKEVVHRAVYRSDNQLIIKMRSIIMVMVVTRVSLYTSYK